ncbi:hypothetical protein ACTMTF_26045 [Nonomuraea sp. ZG12]|uniref:hypothetical protein n=1 Tax=Nonomuraea sp. ZG12 TaxID=3452207 RepID=UPI003F89F6E9
MRLPRRSGPRPTRPSGERFTALARAGLLDVSDARLAADHFIALTFGVARSRLGSANAGEGVRIRPLMRAFKVYVHPDAGRIQLTYQALGIHDDLIGAHAAVPRHGPVDRVATGVVALTPRGRIRPGARRRSANAAT